MALNNKHLLSHISCDQESQWPSWALQAQGLLQRCHQAVSWESSHLIAPLRTICCQVPSRPCWQDLVPHRLLGWRPHFFTGFLLEASLSFLPHGPLHWAPQSMAADFIRANRWQELENSRRTRRKPQFCFFFNNQSQNWHPCYILFIRKKTLGWTHTQGVGITQGMITKGWRALGIILEAAWHMCLFLSIDVLFLSFFFFPAMPCSMWDPQLPNQWSNSHPLQSKHWVLITEPPRKSLDAFLKKHKVYYVAFVIEQCILEQFPGQYLTWNSPLLMDSQGIFNALLHVFFLKILNDYLFLAALGLHCCVLACSSCGDQQSLSSWGAWASHCGGFSYCGAWA